jgi:DNA-binding CsgD family transcriptional regulator
LATDAAFELDAASDSHCAALRSGLSLGRLSPRALYVILGVQVLSGVFFLGELWSEVLGFRTSPIPYQWQELIQVLASVGLLFGIGATTLFLRSVLTRLENTTRQIEAASGQFHDHLRRLFADWGLSASESDVAIYAMKGFSNAEVAALRGTSASTVKSQMNAVFRKSGMANRQQLIAFLVEELLSGVVTAEN